MTRQDSSFRLAIGMLDQSERRRALPVLIVVMLEALIAASAIGSSLPFLSVMSDPTLIERIPALSRGYHTWGFSSPGSFMTALGIMTCLLVLIASALQFLRSWLIVRFVALFSRRLSETLLHRYLSQPYEFFLQAEYPVLSTHILSESQLVGSLFFRPLFDIVAGVLTITCIAMLLLWLNPLILILALAGIGGLYALLMLASRSMLDRLANARLHANRALYATVHEAFAGIKYLRLSGREPDYVKHFDVPARAFARAQIATSVIGEGPQYLLQAITMVGAVATCILLLRPGEADSAAALASAIPVIGVFAFAALRLTPEFGRVYRAIAQLRGAGPAVRSIEADLARPATLDMDALPPPLPLRKSLRLERVCYQYPGDRQSGISDIDIEICQGETIGLAGATGAGKSTLADVLLGLLVPQSGDIIVDGTRITDGNLRGWQRTLGYVPQDIHIADSSIAENIAFGLTLDTLDRDEVRRAASIACLDAFIADLPQGYETRIGERGVMLSGGQRQRLGIARALYHDPDFILFDEATSALDTATEADLMTAIRALGKDKTCLIISHRLSTLKSCQRIIVMEEGRMVGFAPWAELERDCTAFRRLLQRG
ncbi:MAG: ABC transporter ATP-binding protein [Blastomonas sp.]